MKMKKTAMVLAAVMLAVCPVYGAEGTVDGEPGMEAAGSEVSGTEDGALDGLTLSEDWKDYQIQIDDQVYRFPMMYSEFLAMGWEEKDTEENKISPREYDMVYFTKGDVQCMAYVINLGKNTLPVQECILGGISIEGFYWDMSEGTITLPGGIARGISDGAAIEAAYGTPTDVYEGELYTKYTYKTDSYSYMELKVAAESGVLEDIAVRNFVEPQGFDPGEISAEVPEAVSAYTKPEELSNVLTDYQIQLDGEVYALPVPVSVLAADGWEMDETSSDSEVSAGSYGWVTLRKGGQEIREIAVNPEDYATIPENCWVEELAIGGYELNAEGALPGGICQGMPEADFLKLLEDAGLEYEVEESGSFKYYTYNEEAYDQCFEVMVYTAEDGYFEKDAVMEITCKNPVE